MKLTATSLLLLVLSGILIAQSNIAQLTPSAFPSQIKHVVVIFQENRTPDNLFHFLSPLCPIPVGAKGLSACTPSPITSSCYDISPCGLSNKSGTVVPIALGGLLMTDPDNPSHAHSAFYNMCDPAPANGFACRNDGAWKISQTLTNGSYSYVLNPAVTNSNGTPGHALDPYLTFAEQYGWANFMYQTNQGPSYPAHQFIFSGTSALSATDDANSTFIAENFEHGQAGCLAPATGTNRIISPLFGTPGPGCSTFDKKSVQSCLIANTALSYPSKPVGTFCTNKPSMASVLDPNVSWKYYANSAGDIWTAPNSIAGICQPQFTSPTALQCTGAEWTANVDLAHKGTDILRDIANCNLAQVSWVTPDGLWSDHAAFAPTGSPAYGPPWVAAIINAIGQHAPCTSGIDVGQTFWNNTAIVVTWDDWGGWSDNQPALLQSALPCTTMNCPGDYQLGFRVPLIVVSAYTPQGYISNNNYDFGSILRMIEGVNGIQEGALGLADARSSTDLSDFFTGSFRAYTPVPALVDASFFLGQAQNGAPAPPDDDGDDD
jgi:phospholipase C